MKRSARYYVHTFSFRLGDFCEIDFDGCQDSPCTEGTNCTDVIQSVQQSTGKTFNCSECPTGTEDNDGICLRR